MSKALRIFLAVKIVAILIVAFALEGGLSIGDRKAVAEEKKDDAKKDDAKKDEPKKEEAKKEEPPKDDGKVRKSFLSNLLELPSLEGDKISKEELGQYLEIAERKKRQIEERLSVLKKQEEQLRGLETNIDGKLKRLDEERTFFQQTIQEEKTKKGERLDKLVTMYAKMEPKKAAPIIEKLDKDLVVDLFKALPQKQITAILEAMNPEKSVQISEYYGRVRSTREYDVLKEMNKSLLAEFDKCKGLPASAPAE